MLSHFNQSNTGTWRSYYDGQKSPSPVVIELLSTLASQEDLSQAALESSLPPILNSASPADVCCSFWLYVTFTPESIIPPDLYNLFITPASLISHDVIVGILRSLFRKLSGAQASLFRTLSLFSHSLLLDSERSHRESLARVFSQAFSGRILMDPNPNRAAEDISCQWLFVDAPTIVDLERDPWTLKLYHSGSRILLPHTSSASSATLAPEILSPDQLTAPS
ncbi:MAG: hypothetical protein Q8P67_20955 [archaeon]|nr:hypothetical protein [archaeon]